MSFFNSAELAYLEKTEPISTLKILRCRKYSFQKLTQFSQRNNVLNAPASNTDGFLSRDICVSSNSLDRYTWNKMCFLHVENPEFQKVFLSETNSILTGNNVLDAPASNTDGFLLRDTCFSSTQLIWPIWNKQSLSPP
jgi:hypothetical protein